MTDLACELKALAAEDAGLRGQLLNSEIEWEEVAAADRAHTVVLRRLVAEHGWAKLLETDLRASWLLVQHADEDVALQRETLAAWREGDFAPAWAVAYLTDRIALNERRPQTYGTQLTRASGSWKPWPIAAKDLAELDERRQAHDLNPFPEYFHWLAGCEWDGDGLEPDVSPDL